MLAPDSVANIRAVLDADDHALPVWAVRALRLLLDERECLIAGLIGEPASEELAKDRRRVCAMRQLVTGWLESLETVKASAFASTEHAKAHRRAVEACAFDVRTVLDGSGCR